LRSQRTKSPNICPNCHQTLTNFHKSHRLTSQEIGNQNDANHYPKYVTTLPCKKFQKNRLFQDHKKIDRE